MSKLIQRKAISAWIVVLAIMFILSGCAGLMQTKPGTTPDEEARIVCDFLQDELESLFDQGKMFVDLNPQHKAVWQEKVVPAFDVANKTLADVLKLAQEGNATPEMIKAKVRPLIQRVTVYLVQIGMLVAQ